MDNSCGQVQPPLLIRTTDQADVQTPDPPHSWGFSPWIPGIGAALTLGGAVWAVFAGQGRDEVVAVMTALVGLVALIGGWRMRPRLTADPTGFTVHSVLGSRRLPWSDVESVTTVSHRRLGSTSTMLEINLRDDSLLVFNDLELGAKSDDAATTLRALHLSGH